MTLQINKLDLEYKTSSFSFEINGDRNEIKYFQYSKEKFSNSEFFWKRFITPLTDRFPDYSGIDIRNNVDPRVKHLVSIHYSIFINLAYAHLCLDVKGRQDSYFENFYTHLCSVCDLTEEFLFQIYTIIYEIENNQAYQLKKMTLIDYIKYCIKIYRNDYNKLYNIHLQNGKNQRVKIIPSADILYEYFKPSKLDSYNKAYKDYKRISNPIREYRNVIVHNILVGSCQDEAGNDYVPNKYKISEYKWWHKIREKIDINDLKDFVLKEYKMKNDLLELETILQKLWSKPIEDFDTLLYRDQNPYFLKLFDIEFTNTIKNDISAINSTTATSADSASFQI
ncbi:MAG: hypothetical protein JNK69_13845 [Saprospiraceae bacterium]|nr:hypothetical protein [Saprospiraceae bacterium]